jgi:hypothetical protein
MACNWLYLGLSHDSNQYYHARNDHLIIPGNLCSFIINNDSIRNSIRNTALHHFYGKSLKPKMARCYVYQLLYLLCFVRLYDLLFWWITKILTLSWQIWRRVPRDQSNDPKKSLQPITNIWRSKS